MKQLSRLKCIAGMLAALCAAWLAPCALAAVPPPVLINAGNNIANNAGYTLGYEFIVGDSPIRISALGLWDEGSDGLTATHAVGLWNQSGSSLLRQVTVPSGTAGTLVDGYRFADLATTIDLSANTTYVLGAVYNSDDVARFISSFDAPINHVSPGVTLGTGGYETGTTLQFPNGGLSTIYTGPNALFTIVPEPGSLCLIIGGIGLLGGRVRRRGAAPVL